MYKAYNIDVTLVLWNDQRSCASKLCALIEITLQNYAHTKYTESQRHAHSHTHRF